jgi:hypothetical protein
MINQLKSMETTLAGSLRREQMAEISIKQLEAEVEQLNRLVLFFLDPFFLWSLFPFESGLMISTNCFLGSPKRGRHQV